MARRLLEAGQLSFTRVRQSDLRNVIWNLIGTQTNDTLPEFTEIALAVGDAIVLCSNGLTDALGLDDITNALEVEESAERTCERIMSAAERRGLNDDATVVVARFEQQAPTRLERAAEKKPHSLHADPPCARHAS